MTLEPRKAPTGGELNELDAQINRIIAPMTGPLLRCQGAGSYSGVDIQNTVPGDGAWAGGHQQVHRRHCVAQIA